MRALKLHATVAMLAGAMTVGGIGAAMAGADDGGAHAFFAIPSPGSATGVAATATPDGAPGVADSAAEAQPSAGVSRTGVAEKRALRPHVAVTRLAHYTAAPHRSVPHVAVARHEGPHRAVAVAHRVPAPGTLHAMHRGPETGGHQS